MNPKWLEVLSIWVTVMSFQMIFDRMKNAIASSGRYSPEINLALVTQNAMLWIALISVFGTILYGIEEWKFFCYPR